MRPSSQMEISAWAPTLLDHACDAIAAPSKREMTAAPPREV